MSGINSIAINLDRESGTYRGGEMVRGNFRLVTSKAVDTRGVLIHFEGFSSTQFQTVPYVGPTFHAKKVHEDHRQYLFGNVHSTRVISTHSDLEFGTANGDGIIQVPCNDNDNLDLIVRVVDTASTIFGEIFLPTRRLVSSGETTSFQLTRNGRRETGVITLSATVLTLHVPFVGARSAVNDYQECTYNAVCLLRVHLVTHLRQPYEMLHKLNNLSVQAYRAPVSVDCHRALPEPERNTLLPSGEHVFPFAFQLSVASPGTFEVENASIGYTLRVSVDLPYWHKANPTVCKEVIVLPTFLVASLLPQFVERTCTTPASSSWLDWPMLLGADDIKLKVKLAKVYFVPGEVLPYALYLLNNTHYDLCIDCIVQRCVVLQAQGHQQTQHKSYSLLREYIPASRMYDATHDGPVEANSTTRRNIPDDYTLNTMPNNSLNIYAKCTNAIIHVPNLYPTCFIDSKDLIRVNYTLIFRASRPYSSTHWSVKIPM